MSDRSFRHSVIIGAVVGAVITLSAALTMDLVLSSSLQGTWRDAATKDVTRMFGPACGQSWFAVTVVLVIVMGFLAAFGAVLGVIAAVIISRFFRVLLK